MQYKIINLAKIPVPQFHTAHNVEWINEMVNTPNRRKLFQYKYLYRFNWINRNITEFSDFRERSPFSNMTLISR